MSDFLQVVFLGIVEGVTEFLPISSTGHLLLVEQFVGRRSDTFNIVIQLGAILAVVFIYWRRLMELALHLTKPQNKDYVLKMSLAFAVTVVGGSLISFFHWKLPETAAPVAWALIVGGLVMLAVEMAISDDSAAKKGKVSKASDEVTWRVALVIGLMQVVAAIFPGTSRSAATIMGAMVLGQSRKSATEFSFILSIPTMFAASVLSIWKARHELGGLGGNESVDILIGFVVSMIVAFIAVKWLLQYIRTHTFMAFGWYRIVIGIFILVYFWK